MNGSQGFRLHDISHGIALSKKTLSSTVLCEVSICHLFDSQNIQITSSLDNVENIVLILNCLNNE